MLYQAKIVVTIVGLIISAVLGTTEFIKARRDIDKLKFALLTIFSLISLILVTNL